MKVHPWLPALLLLACSKPPAPPPDKAPPPAKVEGAIAEDKLATITLTVAAEQRLAIATVPVQERSIVPRRTLGGVAVIPPGRTARLIAPFAARLEPVGSGRAVAGTTVSAGEVLYLLRPLQPDAVLQRTAAAHDLATAQASLEAATARHQRAGQLLADKTGSVRAVEEAAAAVATATADVAAARARIQAWGDGLFDNEGNLALRAPLAGVVLQGDVGPGHVVPAGSPLCEIASLELLWIRVPMHAGDDAGVDLAAPARIQRLADGPDSPWRDAKVARAPPVADAATGSVDLVYELTNTAPLLRPGERILANVPLRAAAIRLVVPRAALLLDVHGNHWVYVRLSPHAFARRPVQVAWTFGDDAVLERGPSPGTEVVTLGAAELFGTEFGPGK